jgi:hypothetical protein
MEGEGSLLPCPQGRFVRALGGSREFKLVPTVDRWSLVKQDQISLNGGRTIVLNIKRYTVPSRSEAWFDDETSSFLKIGFHIHWMKLG